MSENGTSYSRFFYAEKTLIHAIFKLKAPTYIHKVSSYK